MRYIIFNDRTVIEMREKRPGDIDAYGGVSACLVFGEKLRELRDCVSRGSTALRAELTRRAATIGRAGAGRLEFSCRSPTTLSRGARTAAKKP